MKKQICTNADLYDLGLLRQFCEKWQYKICINSTDWMAANSESDAVNMALLAYSDASEHELIPASQKYAALELDKLLSLHRVYSSKTDQQIKDVLLKIDADIKQLQRVGRREFGGRGRRTGPAKSNEAARDAGEHKLLLSIYLKNRSQYENVSL